MVADRLQEPLSPGARLDFAYIGNDFEHRRFAGCFEIGAACSRLQQDLERQGLGVEAAKQRALLHYQLLEGDPREQLQNGPLFALQHAKTRNDYPGMERASRLLLAMSDSADHHLNFVRSLGFQQRFDEALVAAREARLRHPDHEAIARLEANTLMFRGHHRESVEDFLAARDILLQPGFMGSWAAQLDLADCQFALGDWGAAQAACARVHQLRDECGQAYALEAICWQRLGDQKKCHQCELDARRRGAGPFVAWLREHDQRGTLGSKGLVPLPRWHRIVSA